MSDIKIRRYVALYEKDGFLQGELPLEGATLEELKSIFQPRDNDPLMYDCYSIDRTAANKLAHIYGVNVPIDKFSCYLEASEA